MFPTRLYPFGLALGIPPEELLEILDLIFLHDPDDPWLKPELFDPSRPESRYFLSKPREFFIIAADTLDPEGKTELSQWLKRLAGEYEDC
jgi:hypothetical protein